MNTPNQHSRSSTQLIKAGCAVVFATACTVSSTVLAQEAFPVPETVTTVDTHAGGDAPSGPHGVIVEHDPGLATHTIYRPATLEGKYPVVVWGEGACEDAGLMFPEFLSEIASYGYIVIADGPPRRSRIRQPGQARTEGGGEATPQAARSEATPRRPMNLRPDGTDLLAALDWIEAENSRSGSRFNAKVELSQVAAMGMSCGGLMAYGASADPRVKTVGIWNSGLLQADPAIYDAIHSSVIVITGGESDVAYPNGKRDFESMPAKVPMFYGYMPAVGHFGTYTEDNGGEFGQVAVAWLNWQLKGDDNYKHWFVGDNCKLCEKPEWRVQSRALQ